MNQRPFQEAFAKQALEISTFRGGGRGEQECRSYTARFGDDVDDDEIDLGAASTVPLRRTKHWALALEAAFFNILRVASLFRSSVLTFMCETPRVRCSITAPLRKREDWR
jgi:hypothetical protein